MLGLWTEAAYQTGGACRTCRYVTGRGNIAAWWRSRGLRACLPQAVHHSMYLSVVSPLALLVCRDWGSLTWLKEVDGRPLRSSVVVRITFLHAHGSGVGTYERSRQDQDKDTDLLRSSSLLLSVFMISLRMVDYAWQISTKLPPQTVLRKL